jgi:hypothetical protein
MKMKLSRKPSLLRRGSVLFMTLFVVVAVGVALVSYLTMVQTQHRATLRAGAWNHAMPVAESGLEEALAHLNIRGTSNLVVDGWTLTNGNAFMTRPVGSSYYEVLVTTNFPPVVTATGYVPLPLYENAYLKRKIQITTQKRGQFPYSFVSQYKYDLSGVTLVDSFDSSSESGSTGGRYDATKRRANGNVGTTKQNASGILKVATSKIYGKVAVGAGSTSTISGSGSVGDIAWVNSTTGFQPGSRSDDLNLNFDDAPLPPSGSYVTPTSGMNNGTNYTYLLGSDKYRLSTLLMSGNDAVCVTGNAVLHVTGKIDYTGITHIRIKPGGSLTLYANGDTKLSGLGVINETGNARNFTYYGLNGNAKLELSGSGVPVEFIGTVYAPYADLNFSGEVTFIGAALSYSAGSGGNVFLHYDEGLSGDSGAGTFVITSWKEL